MENEKKFSRAKKWLAIIAGLLVVCTVLMWGVATGWGSVKVDRIKIVGNGGEQYSALQLTPVGVNEANPAPAVIVNHGGSNTAFSELVFGIEYARRGYVAILCDQINAGETTIGGNSTAVQLIESWLDFARSQKYITQIAETGLSKGGLSVAQVINDGYVDKMDCVITIVSGMALDSIKEYPIGTNFLEVLADADGYDANGIYDMSVYDTRVDSVRVKTGLSDYEFGDMLGSFEDKTAFKAVSVRSVHGYCYVYPTIHAAVYDFLGQAIPTGTNIAPEDHIYPLWLLVNGICCVLFVLFGLTFAYVMVLSPGRRDVLMTARAIAPAVTKGQRAAQVAMDLVVPFLLFGLVTPLMAKMTFLRTKVFRCTAVNSTILWLLAVAMFGAIVFVIRNRQAIKSHTFDASAISGCGADVKMFDFRKIKAALFVAIVTTLVMFGIINIVISVTGLNYQINGFAFFSRMNAQRFLRALPYVLVIIPIVLMINISIATTRRLKETGNECVDMAKSIIFNILISIIPLCVLMFCYFGVGYMRGNGIALLPAAFQTSMNTVIAFPFMMSSSVGISTYLYRKTGNIWTGTFVAALILGFFTLSAPGFIG